MKVFVAGSTGFLGRAIVPMLVEAGHQVMALTRRGSERKLMPSSHPSLSVVEGDILKPETFFERINGVDAVLNLVGILRERRKEGVTFQRIHIDVTATLIRFAHMKGARKFIQVSANGVKPGGVPYQRTKWEAEQLVRESGLDYTILRPSVVLGEDSEVDNFLSVIDGVLRFPLVPVPGGNFLLQPVEREEVTRTILEAVQTEKLQGKTVSLCGDRVFTYREILKWRAETLELRRVYLTIPMSLFKFAVRFLGRFSWFPITKDEVRMLEEGNVCDNQRSSS